MEQLLQFHWALFWSHAAGDGSWHTSMASRQTSLCQSS